MRIEIIIFPIQLDDTVMQTTKSWAEKIRINRHIGDFTNWKNRNGYKNAIETLLEALNKNDK